MKKERNSVWGASSEIVLASRRRLLTVAAAGLGAAGLAATRGAIAADAPLQPAPRLTVQTTEGPYYFDPKLMRADITEGLPGIPLDVRFTVVDEIGAPFDGARVDIWHCSAQGVYSGYAGQGEDHTVNAKGKTFLRGSLIADKDGGAVFHTIYPGWYEGRTTHIHFKVLNGARAVLTSQFFLPDSLSEFLYMNLSDYKRGRLRDTLNSTDGIALEAGNTVIGAVRQEADRYIATLGLAVNRSANPIIDRPPVPGEGPPPGLSAGGSGKRPMAPPPGSGHNTTLEGAARIAALVPGSRKN